MQQQQMRQQQQQPIQALRESQPISNHGYGGGSSGGSEGMGGYPKSGGGFPGAHMSGGGGGRGGGGGSGHRAFNDISNLPPDDQSGVRPEVAEWRKRNEITVAGDCPGMLPRRLHSTVSITKNVHLGFRLVCLPRACRVAVALLSTPCHGVLTLPLPLQIRSSPSSRPQSRRRSCSVSAPRDSRRRR
jgi:hypothetical protein